MENTFINYINTSKDIPFKKQSFHKIDAAVLAQASYLPYGLDLRDYLGPTINIQNKTLGEFCGLLLTEQYEEIMESRFGANKDSLNEYKEFCRAIIKSKRYSPINIMDYYYNNSETTQFAAFYLALGNIKIICYRGTDGTYEGWNENFMMLDEIVEAQVHAIKYFYYIMNKYSPNNIYLAGHSKGGNLAAYAGLKSTLNYFTRIIKVYDFDGPGFNFDFIKKNLSLMKQRGFKFLAYYPKNCIVGMLLFGQSILYGKKEYFIATNSQVSVLSQHSIFQWLVKDGDFISTTQSELSKDTNKSIDRIVLITPNELLKEGIDIILKQISSL